jgi:hypothetical protein
MHMHYLNFVYLDEQLGIKTSLQARKRALSSYRGKAIIGGRWTGLLSVILQKSSKPPRDKRDTYRENGYQDDALKVTEALISSLKQFRFDDGSNLSSIAVRAIGRSKKAAGSRNVAVVADLQEAQDAGGWLVVMDARGVL